MELKKEFVGSRIFVKKLGREVEICEENKFILFNFGCIHLFKIEKIDSPKPSIKPNDKRRIKTNYK